MPHDVLDLDDRVVDEDADDEREREQRQDVQGESENGEPVGVRGPTGIGRDAWWPP